MQQLQYVTVPLMCVCECVITAAVHICPFTLAGSRTGQPKAGLTKGGGAGTCCCSKYTVWAMTPVASPRNNNNNFVSLCWTKYFKNYEEIREPVRFRKSASLVSTVTGTGVQQQLQP